MKNFRDDMQKELEAERERATELRREANEAQKKADAAEDEATRAASRVNVLAKAFGDLGPLQTKEKAPPAPVHRPHTPHTPAKIA